LVLNHKKVRGEMAINAMKIIRIVTLTALGLWHMGQPIDAMSATVPETKVNHGTVQKDDSKNSGGDQVAVQLSRDEADTIAAALPEGEARHGKTQCPVCNATFEIDDRVECVFADTDNIKLPVNGIVCGSCGLVQGGNKKSCLYCGIGINTAVH
jgi:hypothetical protein